MSGKFRRVALVIGLSLVVAFARPASVGRVAAACNPATTYGTDTLTVTVPATTTYRVWARIMAPDTTNNTFDLEIDSGNCITVGGGSIPANAWTWVDYQGGTSSNKINASLAAGSHTLRLIGVQPSVAVDRIILTSDTACVPTPGTTGDNCANPPDTTPPTVSLTAPSNGTTVSGSNVQITATANDDSGTVSRIEFSINGTLVATDTTSSYGITWNTTQVANGSYQIVARAYDAANNSTTSSAVTVTVNNTPADTTKPTVSITAPTANQTVSGLVTLSASANDNSGTVARVEFSVDGTVRSTVTSAPYATAVDTTQLSNASHTLTATAYDAAGNTNSSTVTVTVNNTSGGGGGTPPAKPGDGNNDGRINFSDVILIAAHYNQTVSPYSYGDVNGDGRVNFQDIIIVAAHYGQ